MSKPTNIDFIRYMNQLTEQEEERRGRLIAEALRLKRDKKHENRYRTEWGTKTDLGLFRMMERLVIDGE